MTAAAAEVAETKANKRKRRLQLIKVSTYFTFEFTAAVRVAAVIIELELIKQRTKKSRENGQHQVISTHPCFD